jgi:tetratricopeptide (TPR) repeat protein
MSLCLPARLRLAAAFAAACSSALGAPPAQAQLPADTTAETPAEEASARKHFDRALEQYRAGQYTRALASLEQAAKLDPNGKDLFFNLALVHEKLGQLPAAISALERFRELETDGEERERARLTIERLRGAQDEIARPEPAPAPAAPCLEPSPAPVASTAPSAVLIGSASVAIVSLVVGAIFGAKALSDDVSDASTSASVSVAQLRERGRRAEREALIADVAFGLAAASAGTFACVWILTPNDPTGRAAGINLRSYF